MFRLNCELKHESSLPPHKFANALGVVANALGVVIVKQIKFDTVSTAYINTPSQSMHMTCVYMLATNIDMLANLLTEC